MSEPSSKLTPEEKTFLYAIKGATQAGAKTVWADSSIVFNLLTKDYIFLGITEKGDKEIR